MAGAPAASAPHVLYAIDNGPGNPIDKSVH